MPNNSSAVGARSSIPGFCRHDLAVGEHHAGNQVRVDAMVAAPRLGVVR